MLIAHIKHLVDERFDEDRHELIGELQENDVQIVVNPAEDLDYVPNGD